MVEINNTTKVKIPRKKVKEAVESFLKYHKVSDKDVSIAFVGEKKIKELNNIYRKKDKVTDVLSFVGDGSSLGEILICPGQINKQAKRLGYGYEYELIFILIHGLFHLIGREDDTEEKRKKMVEEGKEFIKKCIV